MAHIPGTVCGPVAVRDAATGVVRLTAPAHLPSEFAAAIVRAETSTATGRIGVTLGAGVTSGGREAAEVATSGVATSAALAGHINLAGAQERPAPGSALRLEGLADDLGTEAAADDSSARWRGSAAAARPWDGAAISAGSTTRRAMTDDAWRATAGGALAWRFDTLFRPPTARDGSRPSTAVLRPIEAAIAAATATDRTAFASQPAARWMA